LFGSVSLPQGRGAEAFCGESRNPDAKARGGKAMPAAKAKTSRRGRTKSLTRSSRETARKASSLGAQASERKRAEKIAPAVFADRDLYAVSRRIKRWCGGRQKRDSQGGIEFARLKRAGRRGGQLK